jgi:hypothetical protein
MQFITSAEMPYLCYQARLATGYDSTTKYIQHVLCAALARDLGLDETALTSRLPPGRGIDRSRPLPLRSGRVEEEVRE